MQLDLHSVNTDSIIDCTMHVFSFISIIVDCNFSKPYSCMAR